MKQSMLVILVLICSFLPCANAFDVNAAIERMEAEQNIKCGKAPDTGIWLLAKGVVVKDGILSQAEISEMGLALAKKEMAAFFGTRVRSLEVSETTFQSTVVNGQEQDEITEFSKEAITIDVDQFLRGVTVISVVDKGEVVWVYCFTSGSVMNAAAEMDVQKSQLPPDTVEAVGVSFLSSETHDIQRKAAIAAAKRLAIEQVLGASVAATTQVQDNAKIQARIYASASGFVEEYRIVTEGEFSGGYRVKLVAKVAKDKLLSDYTSIMKSMGDPGFAIRTNQKDLYYSLSDFFSSLGIRIVAEPENADYIIDAMGDFRAIKHPSTAIDGIQLSLWVRIFATCSGQELFAIKNDPKQAAVFHARGERQIELAAENAYKQLRTPLHEKLNALLGKMAATGREIQVVFDNYSDSFSPELELIIKALEMIPGCSNVNVNVNDITQEATIRLNYTATIEVLSKFLVDRMAKDIAYPVRRPKVVSYTNAELRLSF